MPAELDCRRLVVGYGDHRVLDQVSFSLRPGVTVLLGTNGAGKTTLLRTLAGGLTPLGGQVELDQEPVEAADLTHSVAYAAQATEVVGWLNVREYLTYAGYAAGHSWKSASARGDLMSAACNLSQLLQVRTDKLSGGQQRRLCLAAASMGDAKVFLLDEPTAGLDPVQRADIVGLLATWRSRTVLVSTHAVADVMDLADRLILIRHGTARQYDSLGEFVQSESRERAEPGSSVTVGQVTDALVSALRAEAVPHHDSTER